jgi:ketosteroid isomerase-like protein
MYKAAARALIRRNIRLLNEGRYEPALAMFAHDAELTFPGQNTWSRQYRIPRGGRALCATHRGRDEIESFLQRYVEHGIQMEVEDILVNGPPWNMRAAVRVHDWIPGADGEDLYANRAVLMVRVVWGKIRSQEDYEDTERVSALDHGYSVVPVASSATSVEAPMVTAAR